MEKETDMVSQEYHEENVHVEKKQSRAQGDVKKISGEEWTYGTKGKVAVTKLPTILAFEKV